MSGTLSALFTDAQPRTLAQGAALFSESERVEAMFLVTAGTVHLMRHTPGGERLTLAKAEPGDVVAEASAYSTTYHCAAQAATRATVASLPVRAFLSRLDHDSALSRLWAQRLARALQGARMAAELRTLKTVSDRLDFWLALNDKLPPKGRLSDLASDLGVSREALYRELAKRR